MLYAQDSKRFIAAMTPNARLRLTFKALFKAYSKTLRAMKHSKLNKTIQSNEYIHKRMIIKEQFLRNGIPRQMIDDLLSGLGV